MKKILMMTKKSYLNDIFFESNRNLVTKQLKIVKNLRFFQDFFKISQLPGFSKFFCLNCQNLGISR